MADPVSFTRTSLPEAMSVDAEPPQDHMDAPPHSAANLLDVTAQEILRGREQAAATFNSYENRVLVLELQSLVERYRIMDVEALSDQNHELRSEVMALQAENMMMSRAVAEGHQRSRQDLARITLALEAAARDSLRAGHDRIRHQIHSQLDNRTSTMLKDFGELQGITSALTTQCVDLNTRYQVSRSDRNQFKIDAEVGASLTDMQARQIVILKAKLAEGQALLRVAEIRNECQGGRAERAEAEVVRLSTALNRARGAATAAARTSIPGYAGGSGGLEDDADSAYDSTQGDEEEPALAQQVRRLRVALIRSTASRTRWAARCLVHERACAQLQASLQVQQDVVALALPCGGHQQLDDVWSSSPQTPLKASPRPGSAGGNCLNGGQVETASPGICGQAWTSGDGDVEVAGRPQAASLACGHSGTRRSSSRRVLDAHSRPGSAPSVNISRSNSLSATSPRAWPQPTLRPGSACPASPLRPGIACPASPLRPGSAGPASSLRSHPPPPAFPATTVVGQPHALALAHVLRNSRPHSVLGSSSAQTPPLSPRSFTVRPYLARPDVHLQTLTEQVEPLENSQATPSSPACATPTPCQLAATSSAVTIQQLAGEVLALRNVASPSSCVSPENWQPRPHTAVSRLYGSANFSLQAGERPRTAVTTLQPRGQRSGSVRYFGARHPDPFLSADTL